MKVLTLSITIIITSMALTMGLLSNPFFSNLSLINKVFAQESEVFIVPGAADPNNDEAFVPSEISVSSATIVSWSNDDSIDHTITADEGGLFDSGPISPGDTFDNVFDSRGEFGYHCSIHPFMTGVVIVQ
jgi:plastocyanin